MLDTTYGTSKTYRDGNTYGYTIHLKPCTNAPMIGWITFEYEEGECSYQFWLLSECNDLAQKRIRRLLKEDKVEIKVIDHLDHYYTIVISKLYKED